MKESKIFLTHILESAEIIQEYIHGVTKRQFLASREKRDAVVRRFEIIGEATKHLDKEIRDHNKAIPWKKIAGMRDVLIHEYFAIDMEFVWKTAKYDLPTFIKQIKKLLK